ncbi:ABC transporter permease [Bradyrhizobium sp. NAS80.1]|uniref:carbohydrate ABC transporter permease n=1 Tax=Bradyrhizobium sp. NAS80.1 TaxID=1680159 RepID=UPI0009643C73|nr:sugar ABC transporter permease [Bradyrhizobium sp. NAS80.1]OKO80934.1 ABC transporter permease [Bradyrhizobium sp. NAS80.1]
MSSLKAAPVRTWHSRTERLTDFVSRWAFMSPAGLILLAMLAYPILYTFEISFSELDLSTFTATEWVGWDNYAEVLHDTRFWASLKVTGVYLLLSLPLQIVLGFGIAYLVNVEWAGRGVIRALFLIPMVVAPVVAGGVWRMMLDPLYGITNYVLGFVGLGPYDWLGDPWLAMLTVVIIDTWRWTPFVVLIGTAAIMALPRDIFEAAELDGANWWAKLWSITIPLLLPMIAATFIVRWLGAVKMFDIALAATNGGPGASTQVINLFIYEEAFRSLKFAESAAMAVIVLVGTMVLTAIFLRGSRMLEEMH